MYCMESKTLIISPIEEGKSSRGIVTLYVEDDLLKCKIRLYNVEKLNEYYKIGIYHQNEVFKANLLEKSGVYLSSFVGEFDLQQDFYVAIINTKNNEVLLAGGTYGVYFNNYSVFQKPLNEIQNAEQKKEEIQEIYSKINKCDDCEKCKTCKYKEFFYAQKTEININGTENITIKQQTEMEDSKVYNVLNSIIPQFNYVFENYEHNQELNMLIQGGKFVKIKDQDEEYSIGTIEKNGEVKYICYAIKSRYNENPPSDIGKYYQWLPIDNDDPLTDGYFVVFQDAKDLKILEL